MPVDVVKAKLISDELVELLEGLTGIRAVHRGDPRKDLQVPSAIVEFDGPDLNPLSLSLGIGGAGTFAETTVDQVAWNFGCTFCFDDVRPEHADAEWLMVGVELLNMVKINRKVPGLWQNLTFESVLTPEHLYRAHLGQPVMLKSIRISAESEER